MAENTFTPPSKSYSKPKILNKIDRAMQNKEDDTPVADDGAQKNRFDPSKNLGKFLHPKKSNTVPANKANGTIDANTGNGRSSQTQ